MSRREARVARAGHPLIVVACLLVVAGCAAPAPPSAPDAAASRAAFESAWTAFNEGLRASDVDRVFAHVADEVVMMPPGESVLRGKTAARDWYARLVAQYRTASLTFSDRETVAGDKVMVDLGVYEWRLTPVAGGDTVVDRGSYMQVWTLMPDGQWRFAREIWNSGPATPSAAK